MRISSAGTPARITGTGNAVARATGLLGFFCVTSASGTLALYDDAGTGTSTPVVDAFALVAGTWYPLPFDFTKGIYAVIGGTATGTLSLQERAGNP